MNNAKIRIRLIEKNIRHYELAKILNISDMTLCRRLRNELPEDEQDRIVGLIDEYAERRQQHE